MKVSKKILSLILAATLVSTSVVGCGSLDNQAVILTIGGEDVSAGVANFYARYLQAMEESYYMSYYGEDMWNIQYSDDETYQDAMKSNIMETIQELYVIRQHADELEISISEEELEAIEAVADEFMAANTNEEYNELGSVTRENVIEVLSLYTLQSKAQPIIVEDVDTDTSEEDTIQKRMTLVNYGFSYTNEEGETLEYTDEEKSQMYSNLENLATLTENDLLSNAATIEAPVQEVTFDANTTTYDVEIILAADDLGLNEYSEVIETATGYYLVQLTDLYDEEATNVVIANIISQREFDLYEETIDAWIAEAGTQIDNSVWKKVNFETLGVTMPGVETDSENGVTTYSNTYEYGSGVDSEESEEAETTEETETTEE